MRLQCWLWGCEDTHRLDDEEGLLSECRRCREPSYGENWYFSLLNRIEFDWLYPIVHRCLCGKLDWFNSKKHEDCCGKAHQEWMDKNQIGDDIPF